ncbi:hypothetical protein D3C83_302510 [compost metagenome]
MHFVDGSHDIKNFCGKVVDRRDGRRTDGTDEFPLFHLRKKIRGRFDIGLTIQQYVEHNIRIE